jgi:hypothetical protein
MPKIDKANLVIDKITDVNGSLNVFMIKQNIDVVFFSK